MISIGPSLWMAMVFYPYSLVTSSPNKFQIFFQTLFFKPPTRICTAIFIVRSTPPSQQNLQFFTASHVDRCVYAPCCKTIPVSPCPSHSDVFVLSFPLPLSLLFSLSPAPHILSSPLHLLLSCLSLFTFSISSSYHWGFPKAGLHACITTGSSRDSRRDVPVVGGCPCPSSVPHARDGNPVFLQHDLQHALWTDLTQSVIFRA